MKLTGTIAVFVFAMLLASACASSSPPNATQIRSDIQFAAGNSIVMVLFGDRTITLTGTVANRLDSVQAVRAARNAEGIDKVYDFTIVRR